MAPLKGRSLSAYLGPLGTLALVGVMAGLGYLAFLAFVRQVIMPREFASYGLVVTTVGAAVASFFSPCSFPLLPAYLSVGAAGEGGARLGPALSSGARASLGVVSAVALLAVPVALVGQGLSPWVSMGGPEPGPLAVVVRLALGSLLLLLGVAHLSGLGRHLPLPPRVAGVALRLRGGTSPRAPYLYGVGYILAGVG